MRPRGSVSIGNSSCCSRMTGLIAERKSTASISKRAFLSAPSMMSSVTGSTLTPVGISAIRSGWDSVVAIARRLSVVRGDQDVELRVDRRRVARQDDGGRVELGDDRRAGEAHARREPRTVVDTRRMLLAGKPHPIVVDDGAGGVLAARLADGQIGLRHAAEADGPEVDDLRRRAVHPEAVQLLVEPVEAL